VVKLNIGFFTDTYRPQVNGVTFTVALWKKELEKLGHNVFIYYPSSSYEPGANEIPYPSMPSVGYPGYRLSFPLRLDKSMKELDVIHNHGIAGMAIASLRASKAYGKPKMMTHHTPADHYMNYFFKNKALRNAAAKAYLLWESALCNRFQTVTTATQEMASKLSENKIKNIELLSNGVDLEVFTPEDPGIFRQEQDITTERVIGFCGRLGFEKHLEELIGVADVFDGTILIAGAGPAEKHYRMLAEGKDNIRFLGFIGRRRLRYFYSALDAFVFPSTAETQGLVALEANACGTPVVGVPELALKTTIKDGVNGYHYTFQDKKDLLEKIRSAMENKAGLSAGCRSQAAANSSENTARQLSRLYSLL
jgi:glycosyltransferase involved in cell wall biosynthesis